MAANDSISPSPFMIHIRLARPLQFAPGSVIALREVTGFGGSQRCGAFSSRCPASRRLNAANASVRAGQSTRLLGDGESYSPLSSHGIARGL
ncbi:hypothetical protein RRG08_049439 [Elysia crispata]|uniref:Uncharacterized protein n=1 Tax=Elysia crispata TaxID=231223 RepID=A0AAE0ZRY7_9GAST|nr:hypothetical protein RRG08_049439 [Elysia crispata]